MSKLVSELHEFQVQGRITSPIVSFDETEDMPYFMVCVNETLRASPSTPVTLPRIVSDGGLTLNNSFIPPGTDLLGPILMSSIAIKMSAEWMRMYSTQKDG